MNGIIYWENKKMVTIAVIGLGTFGNRVTEALLDTDTELVILDKDRDIVEKYKNAVTNAYITDAINEATLKKVIPPDVNAAIVDLGSQLETSILVTNHLKKLDVPQIIVKARSDEHGEILKLVGATKIIYPDYDAAVHIVPMLLSSALFNYMQLSENFAIAEVKVRKEIEGKTLAESSLRQKYSLNVIGLRQEGNDEIKTAADPSLVLTAQMILLVGSWPWGLRAESYGPSVSMTASFSIKQKGSTGRTYKFPCVGRSAGFPPEEENTASQNKHPYDGNHTDA